MSPDRPIQFGCAGSAFQVQPVEVLNGEVVEASDWDYITNRKLAGKSSPLSDIATAGQLPDFSKHKRAYIERSRLLGNQIYRTSVCPARLCPSEGEFNEQLMNEYIKTFALIRAADQQPLVTLHHFTMPKSYIRFDAAGNFVSGAWEHPDILAYFRSYATRVTEHLKNKDKLRVPLQELHLDIHLEEQLLDEGIVRYFMTFNEPTVSIMSGYLNGQHPPYKRHDIFTFKKVLDKVLSAHGILTSEIKNGLKDQPIGTAVGVGYNLQHYEGPIAPISRAFDDFYVKSFERAGGISDWIGVHYYMGWPQLFEGKKDRVYGDQPNFGYMYPPGILPILERVCLHYPDKPIKITEIGFSDWDDRRRPHWILETMRYIREARDRGVPVDTVLLWALVKNFEWDLGMSQRFGLFDEEDLYKPLIPSTEGIRSWEAWRAIIEAERHPSEKSQTELDRCYNRAKRQYEQAIADKEKRQDYKK